MDIATLIGLIGAIAVVAATIILGGAPGAFVNGPALIIVIMGSLLITLMKFSLRLFLNSLKVAIKAFIYKVADSDELIGKSVELANLARSGGLLALEEAEVPDEFYKKAVRQFAHYVDEVQPPAVSQFRKSRHQGVHLQSS